VKSLAKGAEEFSVQPHIVGITRELEFGRPGSWIGSLFDYHPPRFFFSAGEQRLLIHSISDRTETNTVLARELGVSLNSVKKMWLSIYDRVAEHAPELMAADGESAGDSKRGKEKRRRLLAYLQQHPEELRPVLRRANGKKFNSKRPTQTRNQSGARL
jgi:hypothetical protein